MCKQSVKRNNCKINIWGNGSQFKSGSYNIQHELNCLKIGRTSHSIKKSQDVINVFSSLDLLKDIKINLEGSCANAHRKILWQAHLSPSARRNCMLPKHPTPI